MEPNTSLSPMPPASSFPASPSSGTRKRSIHEVDDIAFPSPNTKRPLTDYTGENQENHDPSLSPPADDAASVSDVPKATMTPRSTIEIVVRNTSRNREDYPSFDRELTLPSIKASNPEPDTPASKKRKVASASQDAKQHEKEVKERQKADEKAKKEEEKVKREEEKAKREEDKRLKAEEKKKREAEREEEKRKKEAQREEERKQRDEKKKAKEDEKAAKEAAKEEEKRKKDEEKEKKTRVSDIQTNPSMQMAY
jgi:chromatin assembly factor 1 subunit A